MSLCLPRRGTVQGKKPFGSPIYLPVSPSDSGYGSASATPERPIPDTPSIQPVHGPFSSLDSNQSPDRTLLSENTDDSSAFVRPDINNLKKGATFPRSAARSRPALPKHFFPRSGTDHLSRKSDTRTPCMRVSPLRLPDRFVPSRDQSSVASDKFRTGMPVEQLTPTEKLLRNGDATEDAFNFRKVGANPMLSDLRYTLSRPIARARNGGQFSHLILPKTLISPKRRSTNSWPHYS